MRKCDKCNEYRFSADCGCKPFTIIDEDGEEYSVSARDADDAALKYAEKSNQDGDYYLMNETVEITVNGAKFAISAEPDVHYSARRA